MTRFAGNRNLVGIASLCLGVFIFSTQDAIIKAVSGDYAVTQAIVTRSIVASLAEMVRDPAEVLDRPRGRLIKVEGRDRQRLLAIVAAESPGRNSSPAICSARNRS